MGSRSLMMGDSSSKDKPYLALSSLEKTGAILSILQAEDASRARDLVISRVFVEDSKGLIKYNLLLPRWILGTLVTVCGTYYASRSLLSSAAVAIAIPTVYHQLVRWMLLPKFLKTACPDLISDETMYNSWNNEDRGTFIVAKVNGQVVGTAAVCQLSETDAEIKRVALDPDFTGRGIAKLMMDYLMEFCRTNGYSYVLIQVTNSNVHAQRHYKRYGFQDHVVQVYEGLFRWIALRYRYTL